MNPNISLIKDEVISIKPMDESMYYDVFINSNDDDNKRFVPDEVFDSVEEAKDVVDYIISCYKGDEGPFIYAIIRNTDHANMGYVQLINIGIGWEIGYHIAKKYTNNGYATRAVNLFVDYLKNSTELDKIYGIALFTNKASIKVLNKCGFKTIFVGVDLYQGKRRKIVRTIKELN